MPWLIPRLEYRLTIAGLQRRERDLLVATLLTRDVFGGSWKKAHCGKGQPSSLAQCNQCLITCVCVYTMFAGDEPPLAEPNVPARDDLMLVWWSAFISLPLIM